MRIDEASREQLRHWESDLQRQYLAFQEAKLSLDLTRGKPSSDQLALSEPLDGLLEGNYRSPSGTDTRNYGGLDGLPELKTVYAPVLGVRPEEMLIGGTSSLTLMHQVMTFAHYFGLRKPEHAWARQGETKFICLVPGYDRHFTICRHLGITMLAVPLTPEGPDMEAIEKLVASDHAIKGIWCVPRFSNPTGHVYDEATVERMAALAKVAAPGFLIMWDNAYALHALVDDAPELPALMNACRRLDTEDSLFTFGSTAKITFAGAGIAFMGASERNLAAFREHLACATIGPDKVNQLRHLKFLPDLAALTVHMRKHAALLKPRFDCVIELLRSELAGSGTGDWTEPQGGYFISFNTLPGLAREVIALAGRAGVQLTPAGSTWPYGRDPEDRNIRIAPSFPSLADIDRAMQVFVVCVKLASVRSKLAAMP